MSSLFFGNGSDVAHWKPNPTTRGTSDILTTCLITLLLCVWTAVHLNVPAPNTFWKSRLEKVGWLILALVAPELVAYTAWLLDVDLIVSAYTLRVSRYQRRQAAAVMRMVNKACLQPNPPSLYAVASSKLNAITKRIGTLVGRAKNRPVRVCRLSSVADSRLMSS